MDYKSLATIWGITIIASVVIAVSVISIFHIGGRQVTTTVVNPATGQPQQIVGSVASPDILSPYFSYGGVRFWGYHMAVNTGTSTLCSFLTPAGTTTIQSLTVNVTNSTGTTFPIEAAWSISSAATSTTPILSALVPANKSLTSVATSSGMEQAFGGSSTLEKKVLQPNTYINVLDGTTSDPGTSGFCNMTLQDVN